MVISKSERLKRMEKEKTYNLEVGDVLYSMDRRGGVSILLILNKELQNLLYRFELVGDE